VTGDIDRATQRILGSLFIRRIRRSRCRWPWLYADLSRVMGQAGDESAREKRRGAATAFEKLGFLDPEKVGEDAALDSWVGGVARRFPGNPSTIS